LAGVVANQGELDEQSALKGAHFIRLCSLRGVPLIFLVNTPSDIDFLSVDHSSGRVVKARAQMMATLACSAVPKVTVLCGGCYGPSAYAMVGVFHSCARAFPVFFFLACDQCGRAMEPNFLFSWPHARMGVASPKHIMECEVDDFKNEELVKLESEYPTAALLHDGVILPSETRKVVHKLGK